MTAPLKRDYIDELEPLESSSWAGATGNETPLQLLVALTDDDFSVDAATIASELQTRRNAKPHALYVIEVGASVPEAAFVAVTLEEQLRDPVTHAKQEAELRTVLHLDSGLKAAWPFSIEVGNVATLIAEKAKGIDASMIVMGLNRHARVGRALGRDTVREVMTIGEVPVLGVRPGLFALPKKLVVAVDFSRASIRAAKLARRIADERATFYLVFAKPSMPNGHSESTEGQQLVESKGLDAAFADLVEELHPAAGMQMHSIIRQGDAHDQIMRICEEVEPDIIAIGSQRHRFLERLLLGSVARAVAADGRWSVLVTPPSRVNHSAVV